MLELQNISFGVSESQGKKEILKDISLMVGENKFVVITGPNGGGKSTLAKMIMGIEKPRSGKILFDGQDITEKTITERANLGISFALQQPVRFKGVHVLLPQTPVNICPRWDYAPRIISTGRSMEACPEEN